MLAEVVVAAPTFTAPKESLSTGAEAVTPAGTPFRRKNGAVMPLSGDGSDADRMKPSEALFGAAESKGWAKRIPKPPRTTVEAEPNGFHANPTRGPKLFQSHA